MRALRSLAVELALGACVGVLAGLASGVFLALLEAATQLRTGQPWLVLVLPLAGAGLGILYARDPEARTFSASRVIDTIHDGGATLPLRMPVVVLLGTVLTHLFGGSAGREGTAVQMGSALADALAQRFGADEGLRRKLLVAGVAGGFGSVFGTPLAGIVFALEFPALARLEARAIVPAIGAAFVGDVVTRAIGLSHTHYPEVAAYALTPSLALTWAVVAAAVALATIAFVELTHALGARLPRLVPAPPLRLALGGALVVGLWLASGTDDYLGLGVPTIERAFVDPTLPRTAFAWKLVFTAVTIGAGFLGGEVTPLFFVGATLGNALAGPLGLPLPLAAGVGMAAVFGAASNAPLALSVMAIELLGVGVAPHVLLVAGLAYLMSGERGIYGAQRLRRRKWGGALPPGAAALRDLRERP